MANGTNAHEQGKLAFQNNHPMSSCDFPIGSTLREEWMRGWNGARNASPKGDGSPPGSDLHPGMLGDGTEEQGLDQRGDPSARISEAEVQAAFGKR